MFLYQTKINGKDGLVAASQTQDAGRQVPIYNEDVLAILEDDGVLKEDTVAIKEDGDSVKVSIALSKDSITLNAEELSAEIIVTTVPDDKSISIEWTNDTDGSVELTDILDGDYRNIEVVPIKPGTGTLTASFTYQGITKTASCSVLVEEDNVSISLDKASVTVVAGTPIESCPVVVATTSPDDTASIEWSSSDNTVARASSEMLDDHNISVVGLKAGTCTLTASISNIYGQTTTATCEVTVTE